MGAGDIIRCILDFRTLVCTSRALENALLELADQLVEFLDGNSR